MPNKPSGGGFSAYFQERAARGPGFGPAPTSFMPGSSKLDQFAADKTGYARNAPNVSTTTPPAATPTTAQQATSLKGGTQTDTTGPVRPETRTSSYAAAPSLASPAPERMSLVRMNFPELMAAGAASPLIVAREIPLARADNRLDPADEEPEARSGAPDDIYNNIALMSQEQLMLLRTVSEGGANGFYGDDSDEEEEKKKEREAEFAKAAVETQQTWQAIWNSYTYEQAKESVLDFVDRKLERLRAEEQEIQQNLTAEEANFAQIQQDVQAQTAVVETKKQEVAQAEVNVDQAKQALDQAKAQNAIDTQQHAEAATAATTTANQTVNIVKADGTDPNLPPEAATTSVQVKKDAVTGAAYSEQTVYDAQGNVIGGQTVMGNVLESSQGATSSADMTTQDAGFFKDAKTGQVVAIYKDGTQREPTPEEIQKLKEQSKITTGDPEKYADGLQDADTYKQQVQEQLATLEKQTQSSIDVSKKEGEYSTAVSRLDELKGELKIEEQKLTELIAKGEVSAEKIEEYKQELAQKQTLIKQAEEYQARVARGEFDGPDDQAAKQKLLENMPPELRKEYEAELSQKAPAATATNTVKAAAPAAATPATPAATVSSATPVPDSAATTDTTYTSASSTASQIDPEGNAKGSQETVPTTDHFNEAATGISQPEPEPVTPAYTPPANEQNMSVAPGMSGP